MATISESDYVGDSLSKLLLNENTTVNLNSSMSATQIQAEIDAQPKNLNGFDLTFKFADGTYTLASGLTFSGFHGGQTLINGNASDNTLSTTKSVFLDADGATGENAITVEECDLVYIQYLKIEFDSATGRGVRLRSSNFYVDACYILGDSTSNGECIQADYGAGAVRRCYLSNAENGIRATYGSCGSIDNDDTGTAPAYGLYALYGATIGKSGTQPSGSTANEQAFGGGAIR